MKLCKRMRIFMQVEGGGGGVYIGVVNNDHFALHVWCVRGSVQLNMGWGDKIVMKVRGNMR